MSDVLVFHMGQFEARFPTDRRYARNHMWATKLEQGAQRYGFTAYAVRLMSDVYFLEWHVEAGEQLQLRQEIGAIESKKAESSLYAPAPGRLLRFNEELLSDPSTINLDNYDAGWLFELGEAQDHELLSPSDYLEHLDAVWAVTQRTLKGQLG
jgi:glycine cleavage system H protein